MKMPSDSTQDTTYTSLNTPHSPLSTDVSDFVTFQPLATVGQTINHVKAASIKFYQRLESQLNRLLVFSKHEFILTCRGVSFPGDY